MTLFSAIYIDIIFCSEIGSKKELNRQSKGHYEEYTNTTY